MVFKLEQIDRAIEIALRKVVVDLGYWPDINLYEPTQDSAAFEAAKQAIEDSGKPLINVYGTGNYDARGELDAGNIIVNRKAVNFGNIGFSEPFYYEEYEDSGKTVHRKLKTAETTNDIPYDIRFIADDISLDRIISQIIMMAFSSRKFLYGINEDLTTTEQGFWVMAEGNPVDFSDEKSIERLWRYAVKDVIAIPLEITAEGIASIESIDIVLDVSKNQEELEINSPENISEIQSAGDEIIQVIEP